VTIAQSRTPLPSPFIVMATQNPIESEGTYPLPEAQLDRFMLKILIDYPEHDEELTIVQRQLVPHPELREALSLVDLTQLQATVMKVYVDSCAHQLCRRTRRGDRLPATVGSRRVGRLRLIRGGARAARSASLQASRALALIRGRDYATTDDVRTLAKDGLRTGSC